VALQLPPLDGPAILLADRGAPTHAAPDSLEGFRLAHRLGAHGIVSGAWRTADGHVVVRREAGIGSLRKRPVGQLRRDQLPPGTVGLDELLAALPEGVIALDVADDATEEAVAEITRQREALPRVWIRHPDVATLGRWKTTAPDLRLVHVTRLRHVTGGAERLAADLRDAGVDAIDLHVTDWSGGMVALFHRFRRLAWGRDADQERMATELLRIGIDAVTGEHPDRLADAARQLGTG